MKGKKAKVVDIWLALQQLESCPLAWEHSRATGRKSGASAAKAARRPEEFRGRRQRRSFVNWVHTKCWTFWGTLFYLIHAVYINTWRDIKEVSYFKKEKEWPEIKKGFLEVNMVTKEVLHVIEGLKDKIKDLPKHWTKKKGIKDVKEKLKP